MLKGLIVLPSDMQPHFPQNFYFNKDTIIDTRSDIPQVDEHQNQIADSTFNKFNKIDLKIREAFKPCLSHIQAGKSLKYRNVSQDILLIGVLHT